VKPEPQTAAKRVPAPPGFRYLNVLDHNRCPASSNVLQRQKTPLGKSASCVPLRLQAAPFRRAEARYCDYWQLAS
jgi:hypothetical protein